MGQSRKGKKHTQETRRKIGNASRGKKHTQETRRKMGQSRKGKKHTQETRRKIGENRKGKMGINKDNERKIISPTDLQSYLDDNWKIGWKLGVE